MRDETASRSAPTSAGPERQVYDDLWAESSKHFAAGHVHVDRQLLRRQDDRRRGLTLIARLGGETTARVAELVGELRACAPEQYFYQPDELHVTILTLISASERFDLQQAPIATYAAVFAELLRSIEPFQIRFSGVTASPAAAMIQGFVQGGALQALRETIRLQLGLAGLASSLDTRYRIVTAHVTFMRFCNQPRDLAQLGARLRAARERDFGISTVERVDFVANDWYMSRDRVQIWAAYPLQHREQS